MFIEFTTVIGCRNNCVYCPQKQLIHQYHHTGTDHSPVLSLKNFKTIVDKIPPKIEINFAGFSEPFQNPHCTDMIIYAHKQGHIVNIYTTLRGLTIASFNKIIKYVSFNNTGEARFVIHLPSEGKYEHIPVDQAYLDLLTAIIKSKINVSYSYLGGDKLSIKVEKLLKKYRVHVPYGETISRAGNLFTNNLNFPQTGKIKCENHCGTRGHIILPNGDVALCCMDYGLKHILGNLLTDTYDSINQSTELKRVLRGFNHPHEDILCRHCELATDANLTPPKTITNLPSKTTTKLKIFLYHRAKFIYYLLSSLKHQFVPFKVSDKS
jgi:sulfatase maturation enzyme AslB (radical SAM superfamily)